MINDLISGVKGNVAAQQFAVHALVLTIYIKLLRLIMALIVNMPFRLFGGRSLFHPMTLF